MAALTHWLIFSAELVVPMYEEYCLRVIETHRRKAESRVEQSG